MQSSKHPFIILTISYALQVIVCNAAVIPRPREDLETGTTEMAMLSQVDSYLTNTKSSPLTTSQTELPSGKPVMTSPSKQETSPLTEQKSGPVENSTATPDVSLHDDTKNESYPNGSDFLRKGEVASSCSTTPQEIQVCNSVQEGVNIAATVLGSLPHLQGPQGGPGPVGPRGPRGVSGKLGPQGIAGSHGIEGSKGDVGEKGERGGRGLTGLTGFGVQGPRGLVGPSGQKGSQGPKGDTGGRGYQGSPGLTGYGIKGQKGQKGSSTFSVHRSTRLSARISYPKIITYDTTTTNHGRHINPTTGKFTCVIPGLYYFSYTIKTYPNKEVGVHLFKNGEEVNGLYGQPSRRQIVLSQNVIVSLRYGDKVWLQLYAVFDNLAEMGGSNSNLNTFSGYLLLAT